MYLKEADLFEGVSFRVPSCDEESSAINLQSSLNDLQDLGRVVRNNVFRKLLIVGNNFLFSKGIPAVTTNRSADNVTERAFDIGKETRVIVAFPKEIGVYPREAITILRRIKEDNSSQVFLDISPEGVSAYMSDGDAIKISWDQRRLEGRVFDKENDEWRVVSKDNLTETGCELWTETFSRVTQEVVDAFLG